MPANRGGAAPRLACRGAAVATGGERTERSRFVGMYISKEDGRHVKNAIDFLFHEWNNKAAAFVSYGGAGGARAVEHLRQIMANSWSRPSVHK